MELTFIFMVLYLFQVSAANFFIKRRLALLTDYLSLLVSAANLAEGRA